MHDDPWLRLAAARRAYTAAVAQRDLLDPRQPGYREAVHRVGVAWTAVKRWEREIAKRGTDPPRAATV